MLRNTIPKARVCNLLSTSSHQRATLFNAVQRKRDKEREEERSKLPIALPPAKKLAIVTCMDARINPFKQLGFEEGDAHIIRNAGGMAKDALRSLVISQRLLGTREIAIYHHTGCGMVTFNGAELKRLVKWSNPDNPACAKQVDAIDFLEFTDLERSVKDDVEYLKENPLIMEGTKITGWIHDIETGEATRIV